MKNNLARLLEQGFVVIEPATSAGDFTVTMTMTMTMDSRRKSIFNIINCHSDNLGDESCSFNAHSPYLRCAINPHGPCENCKHYRGPS